MFLGILLTPQGAHVDMTRVTHIHTHTMHTHPCTHPCTLMCPQAHAHMHMHACVLSHAPTLVLAPVHLPCTHTHTLIPMHSAHSRVLCPPWWCISSVHDVFQILVISAGHMTCWGNETWWFGTWEYYAKTLVLTSLTRIPDCYSLELKLPTQTIIVEQLRQCKLQLDELDDWLLYLRQCKLQLDELELYTGLSRLYICYLNYCVTL